MIKLWDGIKFEQLQILRGHCGEVWDITLNLLGRYLFSVSSDKTIHIWNKTEDIIIPEEEEEKELEKQFDDRNFFIIFVYNYDIIFIVL